MAEGAASVLARFQINRLAALAALAGCGLRKVDDVGGLGGPAEARLGIRAVTRANGAARQHESSEKEGKQRKNRATHIE